MLRTVLLASVLTLGMAAQASAETVVFHAKMSAAQEVPPKTSGGAGETEATVDTKAKTVTYKVTWTGLTGPATMAHFHGPAAAGANAGVLVPLGEPNPKSPITGTSKLNAAQIKDFMDGKVYVNVHTAANPGGEIRGQMMRTKP
jgi:hypothetical protein